MTIIVAGKLLLKAGMREEFIEKSIPAILLARQNKACVDFSVSPDSVDANRVNIFEQWTTEEALTKFRDSGPESDTLSMVEVVDIKEFTL
ncbi:putative quinol monooxygenase [Thalassotalea piscium]|uniref:Quinol monooxygenase YgiN n=1 Tax=Thalassotalea piscium TaxID=1230533 RepID=A0A7X0NG12_9GAMM|nr:antibiotic biosynthesis monooxygenase [Thalassotalea piscium]MBB6542616.1 quinol monooxygenase YgiN [Thalassotalea piscium]